MLVPNQLLVCSHWYSSSSAIYTPFPCIKQNAKQLIFLQQKDTQSYQKLWKARWQKLMEQQVQKDSPEEARSSRESQQMLFILSFRCCWKLLRITSSLVGNSGSFSFERFDLFTTYHMINWWFCRSYFCNIL